MKRRPRSVAVQLLLGLDVAAAPEPTREAPPAPVTFTEMLGFGPSAPATPTHDPLDPWGLAPPGVDVDDLSTVQHPTAYDLRTPAPWEA